MYLYIIYIYNIITKVITYMVFPKEILEYKTIVWLCRACIY